MQTIMYTEMFKDLHFTQQQKPEQYNVTNEIMRFMEQMATIEERTILTILGRFSKKTSNRLLLN